MNFPKEIMNHIKNMTCELDNEGKSKAEVYRIYDAENTYYLKVEDRYEETIREHGMYEWLEGKLPIPKVKCRCFVEGKDYLLLEAAKGVMLESEDFRQNPEQLVKLAAEGLRLLWSVPIIDCPFEASIESKLKQAKREIDNGMKVCVYKNEYTEGLETETDVYEYLIKNLPKEDKVLSHGDYCFNNFFVHEGHISGYIDMGRGGVGDRYQDIALCVRELMDYDKVYTEMLFKHLNLEPDYQKIKYYILLDELF